MMMSLFKSVGPLLKMIQQIFIDIIPFFAFYLVELALFGCVAQMLFNQKFKNIEDGIFSIWNLSMGNFDIKQYDGFGQNFWVSRAFLFSAVTCNLLILLNLIIALMASTYNRLETQTDLLYYDEIIKNYDVYRGSKRFGALNTKFIGANIINLPFIPIFLTRGIRKKLNENLTLI